MTVAADTPVGAAAPGDRAAARIAGAATLIAVLTVASRVAGFARTWVFAHTVGSGDLGGMYLAANTIPNIIFEIVAGGALAGLVVPLLAGPLAAGDRDGVRRTVSALLTWTLTALVPLALVLWLAAGPVIGLLAPNADPGLHEAGADMLRAFAPQVPLYGIGIVLTGVLHAHRRFAWPVLAPLLSSLTVIGVYLLFAATAGATPALADVDGRELAILALGTTAGVVVLSLCLLIPVSRLRLGLRPTYRVAPGERRRIGSLAFAGLATVAAQQVALLVTIRLALAVDGATNSLYNFAQTLFLLPWAVLAVPAATAAYPAIATAHATADTATLRATTARTGRAVLLLSGLGAAGLAAVAKPAAGLMLADPQQVGTLAAAVTAFAPGLLGYGLTALHQRTLYAVGANRLAALGVGAGWAVTIGAALWLSAALPESERAVALGAANAVGMTVMGLALALAVRARLGRMALSGLPRALLAASVAGLAGAAAGVEAGRVVSGPTPGIMGLIGQGMLSGGVSLAVFLGVCALLDLPDLRPLIERVARRGRR
ncbi:membrane protein [Catellatospora sp. TT07R-123]|uniref:murein biosynthesis integral membrane protein MurJ n=1 Tax=Catellatospora sp. TT07R-123 TaxID=2733863 RepID=UPI001B03302B|nr:lipid II flippase MurJ [Catellatospora sp. TT07R-123]GHJ48474.1 membrane protein [Catellatospora sp. TT07R-123]